MEKAYYMLDEGGRGHELIQMIFFLTDGDPTEGVTDPELLVRNIATLNEQTGTIYG